MKMVFVIYVKNYKCIKCFLEPGVLSVAASYGLHHQTGPISGHNLEMRIGDMVLSL